MFRVERKRRRQVLCLNGSQVLVIDNVAQPADNRLLRKKLREKDELISDLRAQIENLNRNLSEKVSQMADMMDKLVAFMMGRGD